MAGLIGLLSYCKKDETKAVLSVNPVVPTLTVPDLTLKRANGTDTVKFVGTPTNPGFTASVNYYLEADTAGDQFKNPIVLINDIQDASFKFSVSDINGILIKRFPTDTVFSADLRIRSVLVDDAVSVPVSLVSVSATKTISITTYGLPRLDLIGSGISQKIESPLGDGNYSGFVNLDASKPFTLRDPDAAVNYGANGTALAVSGGTISITANGWYQLLANTKALTYSVTSYMIGIVGSATPNVWNSPDVKMAYDSKLGCWFVSTNLQPHLDGTAMKCEFKFRMNDKWDWNIGGTLDNLTQGAGNLVAVPGNYLIRLFINADGLTGHCTLTPN